MNEQTGVFDGSHRIRFELHVSQEDGFAMPQYPRAPIVEAVIEFRLARPLAQQALEKAAHRLRGTYPFSEAETGMNVSFTSTGGIDTSPAWTGVKLSSIDRTDVVMFRTVSFACSRLAPYTEWGEFRRRGEAAWQAFRRQADSIALSRLGVRYVNRIDVPSESGSVNVQDYLTIFPTVPAAGAKLLTQYAMQVASAIGEDECNFVLNTGSVPSPLIGYSSFVLDLDVYRESNLPLKDDTLWEIVERMRRHKNRLFESCITDRARELFNQ